MYVPIPMRVLEDKKDIKVNFFVFTVWGKKIFFSMLLWSLAVSEN